MSFNYESLKRQLLILILVELVTVIVFQVFFTDVLYIAQYVLLVVNFGLMLAMLVMMHISYKQRVVSVTELLGNEAHKAFEYGGVSVMTLGHEDVITWISEPFEESVIGESVYTVLPAIEPLVAGEVSSIVLEYQGQRLEASLLDETGLIFFKDVTQREILETENKENRIVLAIAHLDNYEETTQYEEEQKIAVIDANIRQSVVNWADKHNMFVRRIRSDRYLLVLTEAVFEQLESDRFSIVNEIRKEARKLDTNITLSLAFARASGNFKQLEDMTNRALEIAQGRGGDQVVINTAGGEMRYFGGTTESVEKRSKVRVRVIAQSLGDLMARASQVIIVGHHNMDFDCLGSALGLSAIGHIYTKNVYIALNEDDIEPNLKMHFLANKAQFEKRHHFITHSQATDMLKDERTLVIMTDHHSIGQTQFEDVIMGAKTIAIVDHHRRTGELNFKPELMYIESSASSASELVVELFPYHKRNVVITPLDATYMYTGMLIDTNRFRVRSGNRTFQAAAELRNYGADLGVVEDMLRDVYDTFEERNKILNTAKRYGKNVIAAYDEDEVERVLMSRVADEILNVKDVEASFVVAYVDQESVGISARSKGKVNVQAIMERMGGGGHFTGAATIVRNKSIFEVVDQLKESIESVEQERES